MTPEPRHQPTVPSYGVATLADLSSSMLASLDPEAPPSQNVLGLTPAQRACLLIVDGLGWELLRDHPAVAPFLSELARNSKPITAGFPATTVTSLGSICTGRPPGQHGILGYQVISRVPPLLHTPLMSATNAISGISLIGSLVLAGAAHYPLFAHILGFVAVTTATINVVGGFGITDRMLKMFNKRREPKPAEVAK